MKEERRTAICVAVVEVRREGRDEKRGSCEVKCFFFFFLTVDLSEADVTWSHWLA